MAGKLIGATFGTLLIFGLTLLPGMAADKVRFATHFRANPHYSLPALAALDKGFWKGQGLEVEYFAFDSAGAMNRAVVAREIDVGTDGLTTLIQAASAGVPEVIVADPGISSEYYFWVRADSTLKEPKDVKGAKIGVTRFGGDTHAYARAVVKALGMDEKDMKFISMGGGVPQMAGLRAGAIDIAMLSNFTMAVPKIKGEIREVVKVEDYLPKGLAAQVVFARRDFLEKNPALVKKVVMGFLQGAGFALKNPEWAVEKMMAEVKYSSEAARGVLPWLKYDPRGRLDEAKIKNVVEFLIEYGIIAREKAPSLNKLYDRGFTE